MCERAPDAAPTVVSRACVGIVRGMKLGADGLDVGLVCTGWAPQRGGVLSHTEDLASELVRRGHRVAVLCLDTGGGDAFESRDERVELPGAAGSVAVRRVRYAYGDHERLMDLMVHERLRDVVLGWLAETPCDVVHVHHVTGFGGSALRAISDVGQPLVMTLHDYWMLDPRGQLFDPRRGALDPNDLDGLADDLVHTWPHLFEADVERDRQAVRAFRDEALACLDLCDLLFTPSAAAREVFVAAGVDAKRLVVVENGIDVEAIAARCRAAREHVEREDTGVRLGVLGSVLPSKGVAELAETVVASGPAGLVLEVHGDATPYHGFTDHVQRLERCAAMHPTKVRLAGPFERSELGRVLAGLDAVAVPSRWNEVFGLAAREARAAGLPALVADAGGLPDAVEGGGGRVVAAGAWPAALAELVDPGVRAGWAAAPCTARGVEPMTDQLLGLYADAIERRTGERPVDPGADAPPTGAREVEEPSPRIGLLARLFGRRG